MTTFNDSCRNPQSVFPHNQPVGWILLWQRNNNWSSTLWVKFCTLYLLYNPLPNVLVVLCCCFTFLSFSLCTVSICFNFWAHVGCCLPFEAAQHQKNTLLSYISYLNPHPCCRHVSQLPSGWSFWVFSDGCFHFCVWWAFLWISLSCFLPPSFLTILWSCIWFFSSFVSTHNMLK